MWKTGKSEKHEKELHSQGPLVAFIQNVHNFTQLDTSGYNWTKVDTDGYKFEHVNSMGHMFIVYLSEL